MTLIRPLGQAPVIPAAYCHLITQNNVSKQSFIVTYLRLARHGNCGAFGHGLRGEAVYGEGQCGAAATPKV